MRTKIYIIITGLSVFVVALIGLLAYRMHTSMRDRLAVQYRKQQAMLVKQIATGIEQFMASIVNEMIVLSHHRSLQEKDLDQFHSEMMYTYERLKGKVDVIIRTDADGQVVSSFPAYQEITTENLAGQLDIFKSSEIYSSATISRVFESTGGRKSMAVMAPVFNNHDLHGSVLAILELDSFKKLHINPAMFNREGSVDIIDSDGTIICHDKDDLIGRNVYDKDVQKFMGIHDTFFEVFQDRFLGKTGGANHFCSSEQCQAQDIISYTPIIILDHTWSLSITAPYEEVTSLAGENLEQTILLFIIVLLVSIVGTSAIIKINKKRIMAEERAEYAKELQALIEVSMMLLSTLELPTVFEVIVKKAIELVNLADAGALFIYDEQCDGLVAIASSGFKEEPFLKICLNKGEFIPGEVYSTGKPLVVSTFNEIEKVGTRIGEDNHRLLREALPDSRRLPQNVICVPLVLHGSIIGTLILFNFVLEKFFSEDSLDLLQNFANQAAIAFENARLFDSLERSYEEVKETQEKLRAAQKQLIISEKLAAVGKLSAQLSHELNNPIYNIQTCIEILQKKLEEDNPNRKFVDMVHDEIERMSKLTRQMLSFYRHTPDDMTDTDINTLLVEMVTISRKQFENTSIKVTTQLEKDLPRVSAAGDQLKQVFLNLILNAKDAMPVGGELSIITSRNNGNIDIEFSDTGCGIPDHNLDKIFDAFFTTKSEVSGVGLGLSVSHSIIERHHGKIDVRSKVGKGTTFTISLPINEKSKE